MREHVRLPPPAIADAPRATHSLRLIDQNSSQIAQYASTG
jgi:hypothetical protein